jgi:YegS/Rv2252/BmrU family lipid kinase
VKQRALFLVNPHSRRGQAARHEAKQRLEQLGLELIEADFDTPNQFPELIEQHRHQVDLVIVGGGDGSVNGAIEGLLETRLPIGVIPLGTANNLARCLNLPTTIPQACQVIAAGQLKAIDLGWVNGEYFLNVAGIGLSAQINREVAADFKRRWGVLAYAATAFKLIAKQRRFRAEIRCNGETIRVNTYQITICNGRHYGSGLTVAADATIDDCRLDLCSLEIQHWWQALFLVPALSQGKYAVGQGIRILQGETIEIITDKPQPIDTDGEITTQTPAMFRVIPQAISVFVQQ